jgi:diguanylate cyclase (GGDEF)-like protein/PAS domain S-box-containing protein
VAVNRSWSAVVGFWSSTSRRCASARSWFGGLTLLPGQSGGYQFVGVLRVAAAVAIAGFVFGFAHVSVVPGRVTLAAFGVSVLVAASGSAQASRKVGVSRRQATVLLAIDLACVLGLSRLYHFDSHDDFFVLLFVVVIEAGLIRGGRGAAMMWAVSLLGYGVVTYAGSSMGDLQGDLPALLLWSVSLLLTAMIIGVLCDEAHGREVELLRISERQVRLLVDNAPEPIYTVDLDGRVLTWNPAAARTFGWTAEEAMGRVLPIVQPDQMAEFARLRADVAAGRSFSALEATRLRRDGTPIEVSISTAPVVDDGGRITAIIAMTSDISDRKRAETASLRERAAVELLEAVAVAANGAESFDAVLQVCLDRICEYTAWPVGHAYVNGADGGDLTSSPVWHLDDPRRYSRLRATSDNIRVRSGTGLIGGVFSTAEPTSNDIDPAGPLQRGQVAHRAGLVEVAAFPVMANGKAEAVLEFFSPRPMADEQLSGLIANVASQLGHVIERANAASRLSHQALHDHLTGLPNRTLFADRLNQALARLGRHTTLMAVLFVDVDNFKVINDSLGHDQGDRILVILSERLLAAVRLGDTVARFGGDEFVILCEEVADEAEAMTIAERVGELAGAALSLDGRDHLVTVSTGIALTTDRHVPSADLLRDADAAMYQAKAAGRARSKTFATSMRIQAVHRLDTEMALRRAITDGELRLHYQPIIDIASGRTDGIEALVRWEHPTQGTIAPEQFIPIAEDTGLIIPLGEWVLGESCRQARAWHQTYPQLAHITVSVNLSGRQINQSDLIPVVSNVLADTGLDPSSLILEMTESVLMADAEGTIIVLRALRNLGVHISIDDFGTGYSSLSYLKKFPVDALKIDKSFVDGLGSKDDDTAIARAIINLAHTLGLYTVAEGVETPTQLRALALLGSDKAQGYLISRPQPPDTLTHTLLAGLAIPAIHSRPPP